MAQILPSNRLWLCGAQKVRADKKCGTNLKSVDPKITPKVILTYPIRHMFQTLLGDFIDVQGDKSTSAN